MGKSKNKKHRVIPAKGLIGRLVEAGPYPLMPSNVTQQDLIQMMEDLFGKNNLLRPDGLSGEEKA